MLAHGIKWPAWFYIFLNQVTLYLNPTFKFSEGNTGFIGLGWLTVVHILNAAIPPAQIM
jgi:hypothetical protein